jgi:hypothetical protein
MHNVKPIAFALAALMGGLANAAEIKTYILLGQSNMEGYGIAKGSKNGKRAHPPMPNLRLTDIGRPKLEETQAQVRYISGGKWGHVNTRGGCAWGSRFGVEVSFGAAMLKYWQSKGEKEIAIVKHANGGSSLIDNFGLDKNRDWSENDVERNQYGQFLRKLKNAVNSLPKGDTLDIQGVLWMQGESDSTKQEAADQYQTALARFVERVRTDVGKITDQDMSTLDFYVGKIADSPVWIHRKTIWAAQESVAKADANVHLVDARFLPLFYNDGFWSPMIHYTTEGQVQLGELFADVITPAPVAALHVQAVTNGPYQVTVSFSEPVSGLETDDFECENGTATKVAGSGADYLLTVSPTGAGPVAVTLKAKTVTDSDNATNPVAKSAVTQHVPGNDLLLFQQDFESMPVGPASAEILKTDPLGDWQVLAMRESKIVKEGDTKALYFGNAGWAKYYAFWGQKAELDVGTTFSFKTRDVAAEHGNTAMIGLNEKIGKLFELRWDPGSGNSLGTVNHWDGKAAHPLFKDVDWSKGLYNVELNLGPKTFTVWFDLNRNNTRDDGETSAPITYLTESTSFRGLQFSSTIPKAANRKMMQIYDDFKVLQKVK